MTSNDLPDFDRPDLARVIERLTPAQIDALSFGVIRVDEQGIVRHYSASERRLSGSGARERLGHTFFTDIAPCMNTPDFRGRIEAALARGTLDIHFEHTGDFEDADRVLQVRVQSARAGGFWVFLQRP
ncbi:Photoactive yellow protein [Rhodovastum atsumiense]|uniref:Photoactive yellow protein n=1 Tax=Rhodovastum atsumiense TaxID=504468 RepID=A0A5M6IX21_9PROT|nr:PAS domain-containing protein [Rhodovastum atsumiense]KAA5612876.1 PAS domain-containing protein [Rhodovastum atsumiense]CAH2601049.1 Photoactive yellow protein [Rhodovastum atsumiense]